MPFRSTRNWRSMLQLIIQNEDVIRTRLCSPVNQLTSIQTLKSFEEKEKPGTSNRSR